MCCDCQGSNMARSFQYSLTVALLVMTYVTAAANLDDNVLRQNGDVMLAAIMEVNTAGSEGTCDEYSVGGVLNAFALQWFIDTLNQHDFVPGVTIGLDIRRICYSYTRAIETAVHLKDSYITNTTQVPLFGVIGPTTTSTAIPVSKVFSSQLENERIPQISGSATGVELGDKSIYSNFFRVIPPDSAQIEVITELLLKLRWNYIAVVFTDEAYGRTAADALRERASQHGICVPVYAALPTDTRTLAFTKAVRTIGNSVGGSVAGVSSAVRGVVFIGATKNAQAFVSKLNELATFVTVIFSEALGLSSSALEDGGGTPVEVAQGSLTVSPQHVEVAELRQEWNDLWKDCSNVPQRVLDNPWLSGLKDQYGADCSQLQLQEREQAIFPWYTIMAGAVMAATLKQVQHDTCNDTGMCPELFSRARDYESITALLKSRSWDLGSEFGNVGTVSASFQNLPSVGFDDHGEIVRGSERTSSMYEVYNFRSCDEYNAFCFRKVGSHDGGDITLDESSIAGAPYGKAQCDEDSDCTECIPVPLSDLALVIPGDIYFVAFAPVHGRDAQDAFKCGTARPSLGADFVEGINFALNKVNEVGGRFQRELPRKTLGAIIFDSCYSELMVKNKLLKLHEGGLMTPEGVLDGELVKDHYLRRVAGYVGGFFSLVSLAMSDILTLLNRKAYMQLSPTSVAPNLSDRTEHPYFLRLTTPASSEILAMIDILKVLSATHVQIVYNPGDAYSDDLTKEFERKAPEYGICVSQKIQATLKAEFSQYADILNQMRGPARARMVIIILQYREVLDLMEHLIGDGTRLLEEDNFLFLGTEAWARRLAIIQGRQRLGGSITISEEIAVDEDFTDHFKMVDPLNTSNVWLRDYWETRKDCYLDLSFKRRGKQRQCPANYRDDYVQDPWISYYIQAVYAFASGVGRALNQTCPAKQETICSALTSSVLVSSMKQVKLDLFSRGQETKVFDSNGDGENGYSIMQAYWDPDADAMQYRKIGNWNPSTRLSLHKEMTVEELNNKLPSDVTPKNYISSCETQGTCEKCPSHSAPVSKDEEATLPLKVVVATNVVLGVLLLLTIVISVVIVCRYRKHAQALTASAYNQSIEFCNAGLSDESVFTATSPPVQENGFGSSRHPFSDDASSTYAHPASSNASTLEPLRHPIPPPCSVKPYKPGYLTVIDTPSRF